MWKTVKLKLTNNKLSFGESLIFQFITIKKNDCLPNPDSIVAQMLCVICIKLECLNKYNINFKSKTFSFVYLELLSLLYILVFAYFTVNAKLKILTIFWFKIFCWQWTAAVHYQMMMLNEWDEDDELAPLDLSWREQVQPIFLSPIVVLSEWLLKCCTEENEKDLPILRRPVEEWIRIWAYISEERKTGLREASCVFLDLVLYRQGFFYKQQVLLHLATSC